MNDIDRLFNGLAAIIGKPAWGCALGHGTFLTLEFGEPHLSIRNPINSNTNIQKLKKRKIKIRGDYSLWIQDCKWTVFDGDMIMSSSDNGRDSMNSGISSIDGQIIVSFDYSNNNSVSVNFDLGGKIMIEPLRDDDTSMFTLFFSKGGSITLCSNGLIQLEDVQI